MDPQKTCNLTSLAMMLDYYGITKPGVNTGKYKRTPDYLYDVFKKPLYNATDLDNAFNTIAVKNGSKIRMYTKFTKNAKDMQKELSLGNPIIVQGWYTPSGHIVVATAFDGKYYTCNDPAGIWNQIRKGTYISRQVNSGNGVKYEKMLLQKAQYLIMGSMYIIILDLRNNMFCSLYC